MQSEGLIFFSSNSLLCATLLYRKPQKSEIFGAASQDGALPHSIFNNLTKKMTIQPIHFKKLNSNAASALYLEHTRDISVIINRIATTLVWARPLGNNLRGCCPFIKNEDTGLLSFAFTYVKVVEGWLYTKNITQTFYISNLKLQLISSSGSQILNNRVCGFYSLLLPFLFCLYCTFKSYLTLTLRLTLFY